MRTSIARMAVQTNIFPLYEVEGGIATPSTIGPKNIS